MQTRDFSSDQALIDSQTRFERMANTVPVMLYESVMEPDGTSRFLYVAPKPCREILELNPDDLLHDMSLVWALVHPEDLNRFYHEDLAANRSGQVFTSELRIITPSGRLKWLLVNSKPNPASPGDPVVWSGYLQDITARKQAEEKLRETEQKLRLIIEHSTNLFYIHTTDHVLTYVSPQSQQFFDCPPKELMVHWADLLTDHPLNRKAFEATRLAIETGRRQPPYQVECIGRQGRKVWVEVNEAPILEQGKTVAIAGSLTDITERKRAEKEREQYVNFFRNSGDLMCIADPHGNFQKTNPAFSATLGYSADELTSKPLIEFIHPDDRQATLEEIYRQQKFGYTENFENRYLCKDGSVKWLEWRVNLDQTEGIAFATARDITEQKRLQEQLNQAQRIESVGRLAGGVAHDFNNMLSVILGHVEMAQRKTDLSPPLREHLAQIQTAAERSTDIVRQLLAFARKQTFSPRLLDLSETIQDMLKMLRRLIGEEIELVWNADPNLWPVRMDPAQVDQILANLCVNARDAIAGYGRITIAVQNISCDQGYCSQFNGLSPGDYVQLIVSDNGCGMDQKILKDIFEPFFTTKEVGQGTGLGLATVYGIVKQNAGYIDVTSEPGQGTRFRIYLPRGAGNQVRNQILPAPPVGNQGKETVLLVEDEPAILDVTQQMLEIQGYQVLIAATPREAIRLAQQHPGEIHLLLTDVVMPEMNGRELAQKLRSLYPELKRLYMSGYSANVIADHGVLDQGVHFIQKPFTLNALATKVRQTLDSKT